MLTSLNEIPRLTVLAGPTEANWVSRLKEEYSALIEYIKLNKKADNEWFKITSDKEGRHWSGKCWVVYELQTFEFGLQFDIPAGYPVAPIEISLPELDGKTEKMYRGGIICTDVHFAPLWQKNVPGFGIAHALAGGLGPWLAVEVPQMIRQGVIASKL